VLTAVFYGDLIEGGKGSIWGNCVDSRLIWMDWLEGGNGVTNCVLTAD